MPSSINRAALASARQRLAQAPRDVIAAVAADLVASTPVKVGFLRASWSVSTDGGTAGGGKAAEPDPSGSATVATLQATIQAAPPNATFSFRNGAPYCGFLEFGTVRIVPRAFTRGTLARAPAIMAEVVTATR